MRLTSEFAAEFPLSLVESTQVRSGEENAPKAT
jgi:hypothetical protein